MSFNPFLSMGEPAAAAPVTAEALNPFMMTDSEQVSFIGENPFASSASNPFSNLGGTYEPPAGDTLPVDIFGTGLPTTVTEADCKGFVNATEPLALFGTPRLTKPTELELVNTTSEKHPPRPPPPAHPLPPETQTLIQSVTGHMEFTSSDLLDRIPLTRTPSPVSVRDIHSPCPTPEPELLPETEGTSTVEAFDINRNKPVRPPPPPPVTRPPPPRPAPPPVAAPKAKPAEATADDINLFDAPAPNVVKPTKEAILSLYSVPRQEEKPIDFLSDDIVDDIPSYISVETQPTTSPIAPASMSEVDVESNALNNEHVSMSNVNSIGIVFSDEKDEFTYNLEGTESKIETESAPMDCSEATAEIPNKVFSPFGNIVDDQHREYQSEQEVKNPFEDVPQSTSDTSAIPEERSPLSNNSEMLFDTQMTNVFSGTAQTDSFGFKDNNSFDAMQMASDAFNNLKPDTFNTINVCKTNQGDSFTANSNQAISEVTKDLAAPEPMTQDAFPESQDAFDAFSAKFDSTSANLVASGAWGEDSSADGAASGFEAEAFDSFLSMEAPRLDRRGSGDSGDDTFSLFIRPKAAGESEGVVPALAPPPRPHALPDSPRVNPFDQSEAESDPRRQQFQLPQQREGPPQQAAGDGSGGGETPPTPLFDEDVSQPLEEFPRTRYTGPGWEMHLRQPNKKKITGQRFWKKIFVRVSYQGDNPVVQLLAGAADREPFQELPLQACYSVSDIGAQQFDAFGKIFTVKLQYVFYKERPGVRPGQVTKAERITNKLSQFAAYAIQGDYQGVKEFGSDLRKLGLPVEHAPQVSQLFKIGSLNYEDMKQFSCCIEEALFRLPAHRDRALTYKMEEVQITAVDELYVEQDAEGGVLKQIARVRLFFLGFLSGMPDVELGVNDLRRQGREVVGRHDIIPVVTEEWIRVEDTEFHACVQPDDFASTQIIKFKPPDACYIELMRFRVRPPKNRELPLQLKAVWCVMGNKVELRADVLVPGFASRKLGQIPCEDVCIRFPIPECWIYLFRVEKHFRYGSVKSAHRRTGKIKGIERFLGAVDTLQESLIEVTSGQAKYEHQHRAIVWRMPRLPKEGQGAYTTHNLVCRMALTSYDQVPAELAPHAYVEFTMPATQVSHMTVRSVSLQNYDSDPPEKYVRYLARHEYIVGIERTSGQEAPAYALVTKVEPPPAPAPAAPAPAPLSSDSDSD